MGMPSTVIVHRCVKVIMAKVAYHGGDWTPGEGCRYTLGLIDYKILSSGTLCSEGEINVVRMRLVATLCEAVVPRLVSSRHYRHSFGTSYDEVGTLTHR